MKLLRTCRFINNELSPLFYKEATHQVLIGIPSHAYPNVRSPPQQIKDKIQNLNVYWKLYRPMERREGDVEALSRDPSIGRGLCPIFFAGYSRGPPPNSFRESDFGPLRTLAGFETVEIRAGLKAFGKLQRHHAPVREPFSIPMSSSTTYPRMLSMYEVLDSGLKAAFGVAELYRNPPDHCLRFHPRKHWAETIKKS